VERGTDIAVYAVSLIPRDTHHPTRGMAVDGYCAIRSRKREIGRAPPILQEIA
jgi:hypothetical protein